MAPLPSTREWKPAVMVERHASPRSYLVRSKGSAYRRNRRHLHRSTRRVNDGPPTLSCRLHVKLIHCLHEPPETSDSPWAHSWTVSAGSSQWHYLPNTLWTWSSPISTTWRVTVPISWCLILLWGAVQHNHTLKEGCEKATNCKL